MKSTVAIIMALLLSHVPHVVAAETALQMIPTSAVVQELSRKKTQNEIENTLNEVEIRSELGKLGLTPNEISNRLSTLSDAELRQFSEQLKQAQFGGESVTGILLIVVLVLLIIYLAKRI